MEKQDKIYIGSGKKADNYDIVNFTICLDDKLKPHIYEYNRKKYINLTVAAKKEVDKYGKSHSISINTFKQEHKTEVKPDAVDYESIEKDDLPF